MSGLGTPSSITTLLLDEGRVLKQQTSTTCTTMFFSVQESSWFLMDLGPDLSSYNLMFYLEFQVGEDGL